MTSPGTAPSRVLMRSKATARTCSACALESSGSPLDAAAQFGIGQLPVGIEDFDRSGISPEQQVISIHIR